MQIKKKKKREQIEVGRGFLQYLKKKLGTSCGYQLLVTSCRGHEMLVYRHMTPCHLDSISININYILMNNIFEKYNPDSRAPAN